MNRRSRGDWRRGMVLAGVLGGGVAVWADPAYVIQGPFVSPQEGSGIPTPKQVLGKEYSNLPNKDAAHSAVPGQTMLWDGAGGVANGALLPSGSVQVDALGNRSEALFSALWNNKAALVYSVTGDGKTTPDRERLWAEPTAGASGVWARNSDINHDLDDLNGVELWGPEMVSDVDRFSVAGDVAGVSIYNFDGTAYLSQGDLAIAFGDSDLRVDLDALMVSDFGTIGAWDAGDALIFSTAPLLDLNGSPWLDGGEIWTWAFGGLPTPLFHNGHLWDTAYDVMANTPNANSENVDAIEAIAVPEPGAWAGAAGALCLGAAFLARARRKS